MYSQLIVGSRLVHLIFE